MVNYDALPFLLQSVIRFGLYMALCGSIYMLYTGFRRKSPPLITLTLLSVLISGSMFILYSADARCRKYEFAPAAVSRWFCEKPVAYTIIILALVAAFLVYATVREIKLRKATVTQSAIKESIDHLDTGLCFFAENGRVLLVNHRMNQLCHTILGHDLQNAVLMWDELCEGSVQPGIIRLPADQQPSFLLPDGTVWTFSGENLHEVFQITAADTTQLHHLTNELKQKNTSLEKLNRRLKQYDENVEAFARSRERLDTKASIHNELGQTLLTTRRYLLHGDAENPIPVDSWKRSIALLRQEAEEDTKQVSVQMLVQTANAFGITVQINGQLPARASIERLFLEAAAEALTNAVRHAGARTLYIWLSETDTHYQVRFQNDGKPPKDEITEGGGLSSLRRKVENSGGTMDITCRPAYSLTLAMLKNGGEPL